MPRLVWGSNEHFLEELPFAKNQILNLHSDSRSCDYDRANYYLISCSYDGFIFLQFRLLARKYLQYLKPRKRWRELHVWLEILLEEGGVVLAWGKFGKGIGLAFGSWTEDRG
jgi:hypothetical protein